MRRRETFLNTQGARSEAITVLRTPAQKGGVWMPPWLGAETIYSLCCRYHRAYGSLLASSTCETLFGHARSGLAHDVPGHLAAFHAYTHGALGCISELLLQHTVLGYYMHMRNERQRATVIGELSRDSPRTLKSRLGWLATRIGAAHPLKACDTCVAEDLLAYGWPTWRLVHQLPGVWLCPMHGTALWTTSMKSIRHRRFDWLLPDDIAEHERQTIVSANWPPGALRLAHEVAHASQAWLSCSLLPPAVPASVGERLLSRLITAGFASPQGRIHATKLGISYALHMAGFQPFPEAAALCINQSAAQTLWRRLIQPSPRILHPLHYIVADQFLLSTERTLERTNRSPSLPPQDEVTTQRQEQQIKEAQAKRAAFLAALKTRQRSITAVAKAVGVDAETGLMWASAAGIEIHRRPKAVTPATRIAIQRDLAKGQSKRALARRYGLSCTTVTRILLSTPGLRAKREEQLRHRRDVSAKRQLSNFVEKHPKAAVKELRVSCPAAFAWLYRNDRAWLRSFCSLRPAAPHRSAPRVDWDARDRALAQAVNAVEREQAARGLPLNRRGELGTLLQLVPGLQAALRNLPRLPLTAASLRAAHARLACPPSAG